MQWFTVNVERREGNSGYRLRAADAHEALTKAIGTIGENGTGYVIVVKIKDHNGNAVADASWF